MALTVTCTGCGKIIQAPDIAAGRKIKCPACAAQIEIPPRPGEGGGKSAAAAANGAALGDLARAVEGAKPQPTSAAPLTSESEEMIAVPPVGVQTPSSLPAHGLQPRVFGYKWQQTVAAFTRITASFLAGLCFVIGIVGMIILVMMIEAPKGLLLGLGFFLVMLILAVALALAGLVGRQLLLMLADLNDNVRRQQAAIDDLNDRLD